MKFNKLASVVLAISLLLPNSYALAADSTATTLVAKPDRQPINDSQTATSHTTVDPAATLQPGSTNSASEPPTDKIKVDEAPFRVDAPGGAIGPTP